MHSNNPLCFGSMSYEPAAVQTCAVQNFTAVKPKFAHSISYALKRGKYSKGIGKYRPRQYVLFGGDKKMYHSSKE